MKRTMFANFDAMMDCARAGQPISIDDRVQYRFDSAVVADRCAELSARMLKAVGSKGIFLGNGVLERHLDIMASQAHVANNVNMYANNFGGVQFGNDNTDLNL